MQRHGHDRVEALVTGQGGMQKIAQRARQGIDLSVFEEVNQLPQNAFVGAETIGCVKTAKAAAAQSAAAFGIEWKTILEWRPAAYTEVVG
jgi:hypothetical protein